MSLFKKQRENKNISSKIEILLQTTTDRYELWISLINHFKYKHLLEIGVLNGDFASKILANCNHIKKYYMIDPWKKLTDWNKPSNNVDFNLTYQTMLQQTKFAEQKRIILRGKTTEMIHKIKDQSLDFIYIDGDHTLKGITIDLLNGWKKLKPNGIIGGDDFSPTIWQHPSNFEPTLIFPYAVHFAEAVGAEIFALPFEQFIIQKSDVGFKFNDLTKKYSDLSLNSQFLVSSK